MKEPHNMTVAEAAEAISNRQLSPVTLAEAFLSRIERMDSALQAWVTVDREAALDEAHQLEEELDREGPRGRLHGIPVGLKDIIYTANMKTTACSKVLANFVPDYDATVVTRLKEAGALILGKVVTTEFACADPSPTRNPWDLAYTPGGSSSGSGVAVATRMCAAALGSQTGGSTLRPAAYNGIVGFKPTYGRLSVRGVIPVAPTNDTVGILVRSVRDAAMLLQAMAGYDHEDPYSSNKPVEDYTTGLENASPPSIGLLREYYLERADDESRRHTEEIANRFAEAGATVEEVPLPDSFKWEEDYFQTIYSVECAAYHRDLFPEHKDEYGPKIRARIERGYEIMAVEYAATLERGRHLKRDLDMLMTKVDLLMTPATPAPAPRDLTTTGDASFQRAWTSAGLPSISLPSGLSESGLPLGVQLIGSRFGEARLLADARWCEKVLDVELVPPDFA